MKAAKLENSGRLQRVAALLADGHWYSTLDIVIAAGVCAVSACVAELRANGVAVQCQREGDVWYYRRTAGGCGDADTGGAP